MPCYVCSVIYTAIGQCCVANIHMYSIHYCVKQAATINATIWLHENKTAKLLILCNTYATKKAVLF